MSSFPTSSLGPTQLTWTGFSSAPPPATEPPPAPEGPSRIVVVDGPSALKAAIAPMLAAGGFELLALETAEDIFRAIREGDVDLVVVDMRLPDALAFSMCGELRGNDPGRLVPIMLLSPLPSDESLIVRGLLCGADDCFAGALNEQRLAELHARMRVQLRNRRERSLLSRVRRERDHFRRDAAVDALTGLPNRRALDGHVDRRIKAGRSFAVFFVDVDHFKSINDRFGHSVGDEVLKALGGCLRASLQAGDACVRYGGEEFVMVVPDVDVRSAGARAEAVRANVEALEIPAVRKVTVSIGVAVFDPRLPDPNEAEICRRADEALYEAKRLGRNCVRLAVRKVSGVSIAPSARDRKAQEGAIEARLVQALATGRAGLPLLPAAAAEALRLAEDPRTNMSNIAHLVDRDPPLAVRFVALASSALYSRGARIQSTQAALVRVGLGAARDLLLQVVYERSNTELAEYQAEVSRSFDHSVRAAVASRRVAQERGRTHEYAYLCGLLHDIGEARIYRILSQMKTPPPEDMARALSARHHQRAGSDIARAWGLPNDVIDACGHHHDSGEAATVGARIVRAAEAVLRLLEGASAVDAEMPLLVDAGVQPDRLRIVLRDVQEALAPAVDPPEAR